jgi:alpha-tubulin suppressor-like RCC1 family protein
MLTQRVIGLARRAVRRSQELNLPRPSPRFHRGARGWGALPLLLAITALPACERSQPPTDPIAPAAGKFVITGLELVQLDAGGAHNCGLTRDGTVLCWGHNGVHQVGDGTNMDRVVPTAVAGGHTFEFLTAGGSHSCGLNRDGQALCWGWNNVGQIGNGTTGLSPVPDPVSGGFQFESLTAGESHTCGIVKGGQAMCWGSNLLGQLGDDTFTDSNVPVPVSGGFRFVALSAGDRHTCGIAKGGQALCWGENGWGQLGDGQFTNGRPVPGAVSTGATFMEIAATTQRTCGIVKGGQVMCWGDNQLGGLGDGTNTARPVPTPIVGDHQFVALSGPASASSHSCGIVKGGQVYCWGHNVLGQLGDGTTVDSNVPVPLSGGFEFDMVAAGAHQSCAVSRRLGTWCWGENDGGELGHDPNPGGVRAQAGACRAIPGGLQTDRRPRQS